MNVSFGFSSTLIVVFFLLLLCELVCFCFIPTTPFLIYSIHMYVCNAHTHEMLCPLNTKTDIKCWSDGMGRWADKFGSDASTNIHVSYAYCMSEWCILLLIFFFFFFFCLSMCVLLLIYSVALL